MKVSLCGPHSFETSTLPLTLVEEVLSGLASPPLSRMNSYLLHQVGSCELLCAVTFAGRLEIQTLNPAKPRIDRIAKRCLLVMKFPPSLDVDNSSGALIDFSWGTRILAQTV